MKAKTILILILSLILIFVIGYFFISYKSSNKLENKSRELVIENQENIKQENGVISGFYLRGSFSTLEQFRYEGYEIIIFIETVKNIMQDVDNPEYIQPKTYIRLVDSEMKYIDYECPNPVISKEKVEFKSINTPIGIIEFHGTFVDKEGQPWDKAYAENYKTVLKGTLTIEKDEKINYSQIHDFEYWDGTGD